MIFRTIFSEGMDAASAQRFFKAFAVFQEIAYAHGMLKLAHVPVQLFPGAWRARRAAKVIRRILEAPLHRRWPRPAAARPRRRTTSWPP